MKDAKSGGSPSRRKLLKSIAAGGGAVVATRYIPGQWSEPVVDSVVLPAHAQTSQARFVPASGTVTGGLGAAPKRNGSRLARFFDGIIPKAQANGILTAYHVCVTPSSDGKTADVGVYHLVSFADGCPPATVNFKSLYTASDVPVPGSSPLFSQGNACGTRSRIGNLLDSLGIIRTAHAIPLPEVELTSVQNGATGKLTFGAEIDFDIGPGDCSPPECCGETPIDIPTA